MQRGPDALNCGPLLAGPLHVRARVVAGTAGKARAARSLAPVWAVDGGWDNTVSSHLGVGVAGNCQKGEEKNVD